MNSPTPREIAIRWFEHVWQKSSKGAIPELLADDAVAHLPGGQTITGPVEFAKFHDQVLAGFPDLQMKILRSVGDDKQACLHWEASGTHRGLFAGIPATQKKVTINGMTYLTAANGKVTEGWDCWDFGGLIATLTSK
jgi:steroid delta-isomerase-like uncharacterized protein